jgi:hypothetical protein
MKVFLFIFCIAVIVISCKKESQGPKIKNITNSALFAKWELRYQNGGLMPQKAFAPGNGNIIQFNADSTYKFYQGFSVTGQGTFHIIEKSFTTVPEKLNFIYYDHSSIGDLIALKNDTLTIGSSAADGLSSIYIKQ